MSGTTEGRAEGNGRVYQSTGDQHITEHHHGSGPDASVWLGPDSVRRPATGRSPIVLRDRTELMTRLRTAVGPGLLRQVYVLHGLGGCGKTAVASELFRYATDEGGRVGLWVSASDAASLRAGMLAVAADRGAGEGELTAARTGLRAAADLVWDQLDRSDREWLLVIDNADDPAVLRGGGWLRTSPRGTTLVTTRLAGARWWPGAELCHVGVLPREDAAQVLCDLAPESGTVEEAAEVAERLGRLPLALTLAGGYLAHQVISPWTMSEYGRVLDQDQGVNVTELLDRGAERSSVDDSRHLAGRTWRLSLDALSAQGLPGATTLMRLLSCLAADPLPVPVLAGAAMGTLLPGSQIEMALRGLLDQSLTELVPGTPRCLRTHGVLLSSVAQSVPSELRDAFAATAAELLHAVLPDVSRPWEPGMSLTPFVPHARMLVRRVMEWGEVGEPTVARALECALRLVVVLHRGGDFLSALTLAEYAAERGTRRLGGSHRVVLDIRRRIGRALHRLGRAVESETVLRRALAECEEAFGSDTPESLESCLALAPPLFWALDRKPEARKLVERAVEGRARVLGVRDPLTLIARVRQLEFEAGPGLDAAMGPVLVADCHDVLGPDHPMTLSAEFNQAYALVVAERRAEALPLVREVTTTFERRFGPDYPRTLAARALLSRVLGELGLREEAVEQAELVAAGRTRVLGPAHPWTVLAREDLARRAAEPRGAP